MTQVIIEFIDPVVAEKLKQQAVLLWRSLLFITSITLDRMYLTVDKLFGWLKVTK
jgi:hypothetical protein